MDIHLHIDCCRGESPSVRASLLVGDGIGGFKRFGMKGNDFLEILHQMRRTVANEMSRDSNAKLQSQQTATGSS